MEEPPCREIGARYAQVSPVQKSEALEGQLLSVVILICLMVQFMDASLACGRED